MLLYVAVEFCLSSTHPTSLWWFLASTSLFRAPAGRHRLVPVQVIWSVCCCEWVGCGEAQGTVIASVWPCMAHFDSWRTHRTPMPAPGKQERGSPNLLSRGCLPSLLNTQELEQVPSLLDSKHTTKAAYTHRQLNNHNVEILLDSGALCLVVYQDYVSPNNL